MTPNSPILLNHHSTNLRLTFPVDPATPAWCLLRDKFSIDIILPGTSTYIRILDLTDLFSWPANMTPSHAIELIAAAGIKEKAGVYTGSIVRRLWAGKIRDLDFEIVLCWVSKHPSLKYTSGSTQAPFGIDVKGIVTELEIEMEPFTVNDASKCGNINYTFEVTSAWNAIDEGHAEVVNNKITFKNINQPGLYPLGKLQVTFSIFSSLSTDVVYNEIFEIDVVDCLAEAFTVDNKVILKNGDYLSGGTLDLRFYTYTVGGVATFDEVATFQHSLNFENVIANRICSVW